MWAVDDDRDVEPVITLFDGREVLRCVFDLVQRLHALGHTITIEADVVRVEPPVDENVLVILDSCWQDTAAVLDAARQTTMAWPTGPTVTTIH
jgi:hypothetical protein